MLVFKYNKVHITCELKTAFKIIEELRKRKVIYEEN